VRNATNEIAAQDNSAITVTRTTTRRNTVLLFSGRVQVKDNAYGAKLITRALGAGGTEGGSPSIMVDARNQSGWYDVSIQIEGFEGYERRYAGRIENGKDGVSDPAMG